MLEILMCLALFLGAFVSRLLVLPEIIVPRNNRRNFIPNINYIPWKLELSIIFLGIF
jgi:uncharacterized membrane protein